ncbi:MAG: septal ring lytic transglycosylase RlpA family protein [Pseudomonadota bacterium]
MKSQVRAFATPSLLAGKIAVFSAVFLLPGCASTPDGLEPAPPIASPSAGVSDIPVKIGEPYNVGGKQYIPEDVTDYDEVGYASWYGAELAGNPTANGERFVPAAISAAHKTLPLPSYVEVTALDTGRTIVVRVNDRGPFANDRLIDLSRGAADQLGITEQGVAGVRVRRVSPPESDRALLRSGRPAFERPPTSEGLLTVLRKKLQPLPRPVMPATRQAAAPAPAPAAAPAASGSRSGRFIVEGEGQKRGQQLLERPENWTGPARTTLPTGFVVQVAAFGSKARADALAKQLGARVTQSRDGRVWRVRYGPYKTSTEAQSGLQRARQNGYSDARILRSDR